jgi:hypothetical protein
MDKAMAEVPRPDMINPYARTTGPPLSSEAWKLIAMDSHEACMVSPKATIGFRPSHR